MSDGQRRDEVRRGRLPAGTLPVVQVCRLDEIVRLEDFNRAVESVSGREVGVGAEVAERLVPLERRPLLPQHPGPQLAGDPKFGVGSYEAMDDPGVALEVADEGRRVACVYLVHVLLRVPLVVGLGGRPAEAMT